MEQRFYSHGMKVGTMKTWWDNGQLQFLYRFVNREYDGTCFEWSRGGVMTRKMHYKNGYEDGEQHQWYDDGSVRSNYIIQQGRRFGLLGTKNCLNVKDSLDKY
jgi:antitoxin component YwqK of YwqJK toxin-antitoxin module